jgi:hypothetical protein
MTRGNLVKLTLSVHLTCIKYADVMTYSFITYESQYKEKKLRMDNVMIYSARNPDK